MEHAADLKTRVFESNIELVKRGLVIYTWGNVSGIDESRTSVTIKPRGVDYEGMGVDDMVTVDMSGATVEGRWYPSVDLDIHLAVYRRFPEVRAIAHSHSTFATAWAQACMGIPCFGTTHADHFYGEIPCTRLQADFEIIEEYEAKTGDLIVETFLEMGISPLDVPGVLVARHGPFSWGRTTEEAVENSVIMEEVAKMAFLTMDLNGKIGAMGKALLDKHFLRKHGSTAYFYQDQAKKG